MATTIFSDLSTLDFYFWGAFKIYCVFNASVNNADDLRERIRNGIETIQRIPSIFERDSMRDSMLRRGVS